MRCLDRNLLFANDESSVDMEALVFLLPIGFCVVLVIVNRRIKGDAEFRSPEEEPRVKAKTWVRPFDSQTARPEIAKAVVLSGAAYVVDGDTLVINKTQVRLFGVDAPELDHPYGKKAKWALHGLCKGQTLRAEVSATDVHGRTVARCYLSDGRDLSAEMVKFGLAIDWPKFSGGIYRSLEVPDARRKLWLADARQKGRMDLWEKFEARKGAQS